MSSLCPFSHLLLLYSSFVPSLMTLQVFAYFVSTLYPLPPPEYLQTHQRAPPYLSSNHHHLSSPNKLLKINHWKLVASTKTPYKIEMAVQEKDFPLHLQP
ncbi:hypothetical protein ES288_A11G192800v1 [Gossypium darwinii]|uniref:Uncharacterized protein n=2 Tax=Gossypium TaxID=3633 RepID=A0A5D2NCN6_GOSTO|nr:hypothetical protein ES288_A11G192800v1 [Gossypium darwinii]TYI01329.1 hypothetical protein ES332_A11G192900v1 [Gossypium tomentosum]